MTIHQLLFDFGLTSIPSFDNFVVGSNGHLIAAILDMRSSKDRLIYVWGDPGVGKSHLLKAACGQYLPSRFITPDSPIKDFAFHEDTLLYCVDDVHRLNGQQQIALFNLINEARSAHIPLLACGDLPPAQMTLRDDVSTRLGWGLVFRLKTLCDSDKLIVLNEFVQTRGIKLPDEVIPYLLRHAARDLPTLMQLLNELDRYSLAQHKALTMPLLRNYLRQKNDTSQPPLFE